MGLYLSEHQIGDVLILRLIGSFINKDSLVVKLLILMRVMGEERNKKFLLNFSEVKEIDFLGSMELEYISATIKFAKGRLAVHGLDWDMVDERFRNKLTEDFGTIYDSEAKALNALG